MSRQLEIVHHVDLDDGRSKRCGYLRSDGEPCGLPETNRAHKVTDTSQREAEERRRLGEREEDE